MKLSRVPLFLSLLLCCARAAESPSKPVELALMSRAGYGDNFQYYVNLTVGTPAQPQSVFIDTGSSNTIIFASNTSFCKDSGCDGGTFDLSKSPTYEKIETRAFKQDFMLGRTWFRGDYSRDVVQMNDLVISKPPFGLANRLKESITPHTGIMGLGYSSGMSYRQRTKTMPPTFLEGLVQSGAIPSRLFSIYLNTLDQYGSILFGGIDTDKYKGPLTTLNCLHSKYAQKVDDFYLTLEEIKMQSSNGPSQTILRSTNDSKLRTIIDTGTPDWQLPLNVYQEVVKGAGGELANNSWPGVFPDQYVRPCSEVARGLANTTHFEVTFAGNGSNTASLNLELADLFSPITTKDGNAATNHIGQPMCFLRVTFSVNPDLCTSSSVIRAGYWVFDLDNGQVSLAQANLGANSSNVVQIEAGPDGLKKAAKHLRAETQRDAVEGQELPSVTYKLSTATNTIGYATGIKSYPIPTGTGTHEPSNVHEPLRSRGNPRVRRAENAAATKLSPRAHVVWFLCAAIVVAVGTATV